MHKTICLMSTMLVLLTFGMNTGCKPTGTAAEGTIETVTFSVEGMTCENCVNFLTADLAGRPGVDSVSVSLENEEAVVNADLKHFNLVQTAMSLQKKGYTLTRK